MIEPVGFLIVGLFAIGMGAAFFAADRDSPTSRALSLFFVLLGVTFLLNLLVPPPAPDEHLRSLWTRLFSVAETLILVTGFEWILRIGRTEFSPASARRAGLRLMRAAQGLAIVYGALGVALPELQYRVWRATWRPELLAEPAYHLFLVPLVLSLLLALVRIVRLARAEVDSAERIRLRALALATPFWLLGIPLPKAWTPVSLAIGEMIFLFGAIRYHVLQGRRGQFLARFLSPQVARLVRDRGLARAMQRDRVEISVVACDLRGFTAFTERATPAEVIRVLESYYSAVNAAAASYGGTIKDFAGDGVLVLVGAPITYPDHIQRAVAMAVEIRNRVGEALSRWPHLGVGVGVASGLVTVGAIGTENRLEYAAVGSAVNLASRLCARAEAGQVLADERVAAIGAGGGVSFEQLETRTLKGFAQPVRIFATSSLAP